MITCAVDAFERRHVMTSDIVRQFQAIVFQAQSGFPQFPVARFLYCTSLQLDHRVQDIPRGGSDHIIDC